MYAYAPAFASVYRWPGVPYPDQHRLPWPPSLVAPESLESLYVMIPPELRQALTRRVKSTRLSMAFAATATVLTSAYAIYNYAQWSDIEQLWEQFISSPLGGYDYDNTDDVDHCILEDDSSGIDDDEHVDEELLDGFGVDPHWLENSTVLLVSFDPTSNLSQNPMQVDLASKPPGNCTPSQSSVTPPPERNSEYASDMSAPLSRVRSTSVMFTDAFANMVPNQEGKAQKKRALCAPLQDTRDYCPGTGTSLPLSPLSISPRPILKRDSQAFPSAWLCDPVALKQLPRYRKIQNASRSMSSTPSSVGPTPGGDKPSTAVMQLARNATPGDTQRAHTPSEDVSGTCTPGTRRSVEFTEPDWAPFADEHERIRDRVETDAVSLDSNRSLPSLPPPTLGDGEQFWAQHFSHSANRRGEAAECSDETIDATVADDATEIESPSSQTQKREIAGALADSQGRTSGLSQSQASRGEARSASTSELMYAALQQADVPIEPHRAPSKRKSDSDFESTAHQRSRQNDYEESSPNLFQKVANMANIAAPRWSYMDLPRSVVRNGLRAF